MNTVFRISNSRICRKMSSINNNVRSTAASGSQVYESKRAVYEYLLFHYGKKEDQMPYYDGPANALNFTERCAKICGDLLEKRVEGNLRALDIGCSVGGSAFQLTKYFPDVVGVDFSQHFVDAANKLKTDGSMEYEMLKQGNIFLPRTAVLPKDVRPTKVQFQQGDACNLSPSLGKFDIILASNLLCRLPNPRKFLMDIPQFLNPNGHLVLISPYSWLEEYTPSTEWIGGLDDQSSSDALQSFMNTHVTTLKKLPKQDQEVPFLIREHERKFQYGVSNCTVWKLKDGTEVESSIDMTSPKKTTTDKIPDTPEEIRKSRNYLGNLPAVCHLIDQGFITVEGYVNDETIDLELRNAVKEKYSNTKKG